MEKGQERIIEVAKNHLDNLKDKQKILKNRLEYIKLIDDVQFMPNNPSRKFEEDANYVMTERDLYLNSLETEINKMDGQIEGQEELIFKLSEEGMKQYEEGLKREKEYNDLEYKVQELELKLQQKE